MDATLIGALGAERIKAWHDQAARDRLVKEARRARRAARHAGAGLSQPRAGSRWLARRTAVPADVPDEPQAVRDDRQSVGSRAA